MQAVADAIWLVIDGLFVDQEERVSHAVVEGRVKGEEPSRQVRQASEFWLKQVKQVDLIRHVVFGDLAFWVVVWRVLAHTSAQD